MSLAPLYTFYLCFGIISSVLITPFVLYTLYYFGPIQYSSFGRYVRVNRRWCIKLFTGLLLTVLGGIVLMHASLLVAFRIAEWWVKQ